MRRLLFILPIAVFVAVLVGFVVGLRHDPSVLPSMLTVTRLPNAPSSHPS